MEFFGVLDLLFFPEYTRSHCRAQHIMRLINHCWTFVPMKLEELEYLEGHSLHPFSFPASDKCFLFDIRYQQAMVSPTTLLVS